MLSKLAGLAKVGCGEGRFIKNALGELVCVEYDAYGDCQDLINTADQTTLIDSQTTYDPSGVAIMVDTWSQATSDEIRAAQAIQANVPGARGGGITQAAAVAAGVDWNKLMQQAATNGGRWLARRVNGQTVLYPQGGGFSSFNVQKAMPYIAGGLLLYMLSNKNRGKS